MTILVKPIVKTLDHNGYITNIDESSYMSIVSSLSKTFPPCTRGEIKVMCTLDEDMVVSPSGMKVYRRDIVIKHKVYNGTIVIHTNDTIRKGIMPCPQEYMSSYIITENNVFTINPFVTVICEKQQHDGVDVTYLVYCQVSKDSHIDCAVDCIRRLLATAQSK